MALCYYSTNPWIKWYICNRWRNDVHYVWCSEVFDARSVGATHYGSLIPDTSNPCAIYRDLARAVRVPDRHNPKIVEQRASITARTEEWRQKGEITDDVANEIIEIVQTSGDFGIWRPKIYVIPQAGIDPARVKRVPLKARASLGDEFIIADLRGSEFELIAFDD